MKFLLPVPLYDPTAEYPDTGDIQYATRSPSVLPPVEEFSKLKTLLVGAELPQTFDEVPAAAVLLSIKYLLMPRSLW